MKKTLVVLSAILLVAVMAIPVLAEFPLEDFTLPEEGIHFGFNGDAKDDSGALVGELVGDPTFVEGRDGTANGAVYLDDNEQYILLGKYVDAASYTASFWAKVEDNTEHVFLCSSILGSIRIIHDGGVYVGNTINGVVDNVSGYAAPRDEWVNLTFVYNGESETMDIYANGEFQDTLSGALPLPFTLLGNEATDQKGWQSYPFLTLDDAYFFPRAFTEDEVKALYNGETVSAPAASDAAAAGESAFEEIWVTAEQEFYDDPETLELGGHGQPIQYVDGYGVGYSSLNDQVIFRDIDFGANGADKMLINFSNGGEKDTTLAIYIDEKSGDPDATFSIPNTGGWEAVWAEDFESAIDVKSGVHDVIIEFTNDNSGSFYYIKFFEKAAGGDAAPAEEGELANYAKGAAVTVSSTETADFPGELAVDGNLETRWASAYTDDETITVDIGAIRPIGYIELYWETALASDFEIYTGSSADNLQEHTIATVTGNSDTHNVFEFDLTTARYITIHCSKRATEWGNSLYEIIVRKSADEVNTVAGPAGYPSSGCEVPDGSVIINGARIGLEEGWGGNAAAGRDAAFDGDINTFFDPLGTGDGWAGIDAGEEYTLTKIMIHPRDGQLPRFNGAEIDGSNDPDFVDYTPIWISVEEADEFKWYEIDAADFDDIGSFRYYRYFNGTNHGDVADVELYGYPTAGGPGSAEALPGFETADEAVASIGKTAIAGYTFVEGTNGNGGEGPENLWDGDVATKFCTGEFPISSTAELDGWYTVDGIVMATANDNAEYNGRLPSAWTVSGSADGENWTVIASGDESFFAEANFRYFAGDASSDAIKFVKFDAEGASSGCFQISELVLTGAKAEAPAVYPASGAEGTLINGTVIGNAEGWGGNAAAGAAAAFDGNVATFFDPLGVGDGFCGIDAGEAYILDKVVIMSRADWNARFKGAMIQGSNDGENWTTLWTSDGEGTNPDWYTVTEFENNTGYSQFRYFNTTEHGDVAEVEFYGTAAGTADAALDNKAEAPNTFDFGVVAAVAAVISLGGFAVSKKKH